MKAKILVEEASKNVFIMPFINCLGYDVSGPLEVVPEIVADIGIRKGEKVDYEILKDGVPIIVVEYKHWSADLDRHNSQLFRYFHTTAARSAILTNGIVFRFCTVLVETNKMDDKPFFEFRIDDMKDVQVGKLKEFYGSYFNLDTIINTASELKFMSDIRNMIVKEISEPTDNSSLTVQKQYTLPFSCRKYWSSFQASQKLFRQYINDAINERLISALATDQQKAVEIEKEELL